MAPYSRQCMHYTLFGARCFTSCVNGECDLPSALATTSESPWQHSVADACPGQNVGKVFQPGIWRTKLKGTEEAHDDLQGKWLSLLVGNCGGC